ncbi:PIN domain-containing protein [Desulfonema limicola]|uniref:PIN domain-containing protein n=1 Tax=Desulfonema limicola TaxID=45656 RepID=A0A975BBU1_9BACT|nr:type II toxin-antitoxin system VapC family toxin [Desulfonema limicola]QTA82487.1 PIN domain-containing protein [Desulfonema limicola]
MKKYIFDTSALLTFIENEEGVEIVEELLEKSIENENNIFISTISIIELYYISLREQGKDIAEERLTLIDNIPLIQESISNHLVKIIGNLKVYNSMSFADCCIAGLAKYKNAVLVHKDPEFESIENEIEQLKLPYKKKKHSNKKG